MNNDDLPAGVAETIRLIGRKWAVHILYHLQMNPMSFGELRETVKGISASVLSDLLNEFIDNDIVENRVTSVSPQKSSYFITSFGEVLCEIIEKIMEWGENLVEKQATRVKSTKVE